jgi:hypothetical protein
VAILEKHFQSGHDDSEILTGLNSGALPQPLALLRARRERPSGYTAADKCDEFSPPHGAYPTANDHRRSIAGLGVGQWRALQ